MIEGFLLRFAPFKLLLVAILCFCVGWSVNGWRLRSRLSEMEAAHAQEQTEQATAALNTLQADADKIHAAATEYAGIKDTLAPKIAALTKELRNAKPLARDCKPDEDRAKILDSAIDTVNSTLVTQ